MPSFAFAAGLAEGANVLREVGNRVVGIPEILGSLAGARRVKKLRVSLAILRDEEGAPVANEADVRRALDEAGRVLRASAGVELVAARQPLVSTLDEKAPEAALDAACAEGSWRADFGAGGAFFRDHAVRDGPAALVTGSGAPITVFVVRNVVGRAGCSLGPLTDYVTVDRGALQERLLRVLAHELGHACGLPHSDDQRNLMYARVPGERLAPWQAAVFRSSRHVTYR
jgi:Matrixin